MKVINLTKGYAALVDDADYELLSKFKWFANVHKSGYVCAIKNKTIDSPYIKMHRLILGVTNRSVLVDHKDGNPLNNQRSNLRLCNDSQSACNVRSAKNSTSKYLGVSRHTAILNRKTKKSGTKTYVYKAWRATIFKDYKQISIGRFKTEIEAALAYNEAAKRIHGEFARLNNIAA